MRMKRWSAGVALAATAATVAACGSAPDEGGGSADKVAKDKPVRIAYFAAAEANSYAQAQFNGIKEATGKDKATVRLFDGNFESTKQVNQIQDATASGKYDAFIVDANDGNALIPAIKQAKAEGITVIGAFVPIGPNLSTYKRQTNALASTVGISFGASGESYGRLIVQACKGKSNCKVAYLPGDNNLPLEKARTDGVKRVVAKEDNIRLSANKEAGYLSDTGLKTAQDVLQATPDVDVIASNDQAITGATQAVKQAGRDGEVRLIGGGASKQAVKQIRNGTWYGAVVNVPTSEGRVGAQTAIKAARGEKVPIERNSDELSPVGPTVTKKNLGDFMGEWSS